MKEFRLFLFICSFLFLISTAKSQVINYFETPVNLQLYPRGSNDSADVKFRGEILSAGYDSMHIELYKNNVLQLRKSRSLIYNLGKAEFDIAHRIRVGLSEYKFRVLLNSTLVKTVDSVVCGDVFLIMGQSNAVEVNSTFTYKNEFCRTFGKHTGNYNSDPYNPADTLWALSTGNAGQVPGNTPNVGVWGLQLQKILKENYALPTCFINGGRASGFLSIQLRNNANPEDLTSIYGKLLYRVRKAHVDQNVKAIIWYGGESDGYPPGYLNYIANWATIYSQWHQDYPGFRKIFSLQVRPGCSSGEDLDKLREKQRQIGALYSDIELFSTSGISEHYGCHHGVAGYVELANFLSRNITKEFYGGTDTLNIYPPNIKYAFYNSARNKIKILFTGSNVRGWPNDTTYGSAQVVNHKMKDYFYLDGVYGNVSGGTVSGDTLILNLINPSLATRLTYLPASRDHTELQVYEGPFLRNPRGLGALTFYDFPISDSMITPVELFSFNHFVDLRDVILNWITNSEQNNSGFEIQRYSIENEQVWTSVGFVEASSGGDGSSYSFTDKGLSSGKYLYRLKQIDYNGNYEYHDLKNEVVIGIPAKFNLYQNYPNPFNPSTKIDFDIPYAAYVQLIVFDVTGKKVRTLVNEFRQPGYYTVNFESNSSGIFYYALNVNTSVGKFASVKKMINVK